MGGFNIWYLIIMVSLANAPLSLYNTTWQNYFSDVVQPQQRNSLYTMRTSMTFAAGILVVQVTGLLLGQAANDKIRILLYQACYLLAFGFSILQWLTLRQSPAVESEDSGYGLRELILAIKAIIDNRPFLSFIGISFVFHIGWYMAWPLFFLLQVDYMQANESWLSYVIVSASVLQWLTVGFWSRFIDKHGIRLAVVIGAIGLTVNPLFAVMSSYFPIGWRMPAMLVFNLINAATFSSFQLSILQCLFEVVPNRFKQLNLSLYTTLLLFANAFMQFFGVRFYVMLGDTHTAMTIALAVSAAIRLLGTILFVWRWYRLRYEPDAGKRY
jgi:Na+/melibiose symporter-like transporter